MRLIQEQGEVCILRFEKGERFPHLFHDWLSKKGIEGAFFYGLGGALSLRLGSYRLAIKQYQFQEFSGEHFEILHLVGNVAKFEGSLKTHAHVSFSDKNFQAYGGHLDWLEVGGTLEVYVHHLEPLSRSADEQTGLALLQ